MEERKFFDQVDEAKESKSLRELCDSKEVAWTAGTPAHGNVPDSRA